jgi:hypothetical protein
MGPIREKSQLLRKKGDTLSLALERLSQALSVEVPGRERDWADAVEDELARIEQWLRQQVAATEAPDGPLAEVDQTRPTLVRQSDEVCRNQSDLLDQVIALREEVKQAARTFSSPGDQANASPARKSAIPDFGTIRRRAEQFIAGLQQNKETESKLILESVNTDIGVGD